MAQPKLKVLDGGKAVPPKKRRKRKAPITSASVDPNIKATDRTFEITAHFALAEHLIEKKLRIRVPKGGLEDNIFDLHNNHPAYFGLVSEHITGKKWTPYGFGHIQLQSDLVIREVFPGLEKDEKVEPKDEKK